MNVFVCLNIIIFLGFIYFFLSLPPYSYLSSCLSLFFCICGLVVMMGSIVKELAIAIVEYIDVGACNAHIRDRAHWSI